MKSQREIFKELTKILLAYKFRVIVSMLLLIISTVCIVYAPKIAGQTVNIFIGGVDWAEYDELLTNLVLLVALTVAGYGLKAISSRIIVFASEKITYELRMKLYDRLLGAQLNNIYTNTSGDIMARINNDLMNVRNFIMVYLSEFLAEVLTVVLATILMITTDWQLGLCYLCLLPIYLVCLLFADIKSKSKYKRRKPSILKEHLHSQRLSFLILFEVHLFFEFNF